MHVRGSITVLKALVRREPVLLVVRGGGMSCVNSLGVLAGFVGENLSQFSGAIAYSGGACNVASLLSSPEKLERVMEVYEYMVREKFFRLSWGIRGLRPVFNLDELIHTLQGKRVEKGLPALDEANIKAHPNPFFVVATNHKDGTGEFLDAKANLFPSLRATLSVQGACPPVMLNGHQVSDGGPGMSVVSAIRKVRTRNVVVIMNRPPVEELTWSEQYCAPFITRVVLAFESRSLREAAALMDVAFSKELRRLEVNKYVKSLFIYPSVAEDVWPYTTNIPLMRRAFENAKTFSEGLARQVRAA